MALMVLGLPLLVHAGERLRWRSPEPLPPPPVEEPVVVEPVAPAEPPPPPAPPLFPAGVPITLTQLPPGLANVSAQGCNACHYQAHDDWSRSGHRAAWVSPPFRAAMKATGESPLCLSCHLPLTVQQPRLVEEYRGGPLTEAKTRENTAWDPTLQQEGVTCAACHVRDGVVISTRPAPKAPHPVAVSEELGRSETCATCHQLTWQGADKPFYDTYGEWSRSKWAEAGVRCQDCHMPLQGGLVVAGRYEAQASHRFTAEAGRGLSVLLKAQPGGAVRGKPFKGTLTLQNTGAGHAIPTGTPFQALRVEVTLYDEKGKVVGAPFRHDLRREVMSAPPYTTLSDNRLQAGEERVVEVVIDLPQKSGGGAGTLEVRLLEVGVDSTTSVPFSIQRIPIQVY